MKTGLFSFAAATLLASTLSAGAVTLYQDSETGAIYTKPGEGRVELGDFVRIEDRSGQEHGEFAKAGKKSGVTLKAKVATLKFGGKHYLGYLYSDDKTAANEDESLFETRRNYFQVKAYWNATDYMRMTLDTHQDDTGDWKVRLKYAYIYLNLSDYIPYTGVEFGQAHRPWIDWEEHHGWLYRSIAKTFVEEHYGAHLTNSADLGVNFQTKTDYFSSEIGLYNGEGYHGEQVGTNMSFEWRLTANVFGTGRKHVHATEDEYLDISFLGQLNDGYKGGEDLNWYGIHAVYNQPMFLLAGMYYDADNNGESHEGKGYSFNGEFRPVDKWALLGRYDHWTDESGDEDVDRDEIIGGVAYTYNKNVKFIVNAFDIDVDDDSKDETKYMFTTEVHW